MKAIVTKFHGPTNTRGSRISASDQDGNRISMFYDHALTSQETHDLAAKTLCLKMGWTAHSLVRGSIANTNVYVMDADWTRVPFTVAEQTLGEETRQQRNAAPFALRVTRKR